MVIMLLIVLAAGYFALQGVEMHGEVSVQEELFHQLQADYFTQAKSLRDGAETGSALNANLVEIVNYPSELLRLKLVGVGKILTGIFFLLFAILMALVSMPVRLGMLLKK